MSNRMRRRMVKRSRMLAAAQVLLDAIRSSCGFGSRVETRVGPAEAGSSLVTRVFTLDELVEAMGLLTRIGVVPDNPTGRRTVRCQGRSPWSDASR